MKCKHFRIEELVDEKTFEKYGEKCWEFFDPNLLMAIDTIKEAFPDGTMTINNWLWGGDRQWSGLRTANSKYYSFSSMHSWGKAIDAVFSDYTADEVRRYVLKNRNLFSSIKGIETNISWLHIDTRNRDDLITFAP